MTTPHSSTIASSVDPKVRDYIEAKINEALRPIRDEIVVLNSAVLDARISNDTNSETVKSRIGSIEQILKLSRGRIEQIAAKLGDN
jgi:hypothetical protein